MAQQVLRFVCLASSRKPGGRCVAGRLLTGTSSEWVRPVSLRASQEIILEERQFEDGTEPELLDILEVAVTGPSPGPHQPENWRIDPNRYWEHLGQMDQHVLANLLEQEGDLWATGFSSFEASNDKVPETAEVDCSLRLISVDNLHVRVYLHDSGHGNARRRVQARFKFNGRLYALQITDLDVEAEFFAQPNGDYAIGSVILTVSLTEAWNGYCFKVVAAVFRE